MNANDPRLLIYGFCLLWCGVLLGVSFIATPAKFLVAELDLVTAIKIGRSTFAVYRYVELSLAAVLLLMLFKLNAGKPECLYFSLLGLVLLVQYLGVLPLLEANSNILFDGQNQSEKSSSHLYYVFCDCAKTVLLIGFLPAINYISPQPKK